VTKYRRDKQCITLTASVCHAYAENKPLLHMGRFLWFCHQRRYLFGYNGALYCIQGYCIVQ